MTENTLKIGFIGAGSICKQRHLPGLARIDGVQVQAVCNRSAESSQAVAAAYAIPDVMDDWQALVQRDDIDAVFIGTWPYKHREMVVAALQAGKHVFCQARMASDLQEARAMLAASEAYPNQVAMICPPPHRMPWEATVCRMLSDGSVGKLREVHVVCRNNSDMTSETINWRQQTQYSGKQIMQVGIWAETLHAWVGPYRSLAATLATPIHTKFDADGREVPVRIPQIVTIQGVLECGAVITEVHSGVDPHANLNRITLMGDHGTLVVDAMKQISFGTNTQDLEPFTPPEHEQRDWCVEEDFVAAVRSAQRGEPFVVDCDFPTGILYMQKLAAVHDSANLGKAVMPSDR